MLGKLVNYNQLFHYKKIAIYLCVFLRGSSAHQSAVRTTVPHVKECFSGDLTPENIQFNIMTR